MILLRNFSLFGALFSVVVIALGAWTRLVDAGLGCPDWPGCYGFVTFPTSEADIAIAESRYTSLYFCRIKWGLDKIRCKDEVN